MAAAVVVDVGGGVIITIIISESQLMTRPKQGTSVTVIQCEVSLTQKHPGDTFS